MAQVMSFSQGHTAINLNMQVKMDGLLTPPAPDFVAGTDPGHRQRNPFDLRRVYRYPVSQSLRRLPDNLPTGPGNDTHNHQSYQPIEPGPAPLNSHQAG